MAVVLIGKDQTVVYNRMALILVLRMDNTLVGYFQGKGSVGSCEERRKGKTDGKI